MQHIKVVAAILQHNDNFLLQKQTKEFYKDHLWLPGGKIEQNETKLQALHREIQEETALTIKQAKEIGYYYETVENERIVQLYVFHATTTDWNYQHSIEGELFPLTQEEIINPTVPFCPLDHKALLLFFQNKIPFKRKITFKKQDNTYICLEDKTIKSSAFNT